MSPTLGQEWPGHSISSAGWPRQRVSEQEWEIAQRPALTHPTHTLILSLKDGACFLSCCYGNKTSRLIDIPWSLGEKTQLNRLASKMQERKGETPGAPLCLSTWTEIIKN